MLTCNAVSTEKATVGDASKTCDVSASRLDPNLSQKTITNDSKVSKSVHRLFLTNRCLTLKLIRILCEMAKNVFSLERG